MHQRTFEMRFFQVHFAKFRAIKHRAFEPPTLKVECVVFPIKCPVSEIPSHNHWVVIRSPCLLDSEAEMARGPAVKIILGDSERRLWKCARGAERLLGSVGGEPRSCCWPLMG